MAYEKVSLSVPGILKYIHFISDAGDLLFRERITFYAEDLLASFLQDMRIVMYELFSNAIQHSRSEYITVDFELTEDDLSVTFKTNNVGYGIKPMGDDGAGREVIFPPFAPEIIGSEIVVYADVENQVFCTPTGPFAASFVNRKRPKLEIDIDNLPEHYGLNLITKFSHGAGYLRDEDGVDRFCIRRKLR